MKSVQLMIRAVFHDPRRSLAEERTLVIRAEYLLARESGQSPQRARLSVYLREIRRTLQWRWFLWTGRHPYREFILSRGVSAAPERASTMSGEGR